MNVPSLAGQEDEVLAHELEASGSMIVVWIPLGWPGLAWLGLYCDVYEHMCCPLPCPVSYGLVLFSWIGQCTSATFQLASCLLFAMLYY